MSTADFLSPSPHSPRARFLTRHSLPPPLRNDFRHLAPLVYFRITSALRLVLFSRCPRPTVSPLLCVIPPKLAPSLVATLPSRSEGGQGGQGEKRAVGITGEIEQEKLEQCYKYQSTIPVPSFFALRRAVLQSCQ